MSKKGENYIYLYSVFVILKKLKKAYEITYLPVCVS